MLWSVVSVSIMWHHFWPAQTRTYPELNSSSIQFNQVRLEFSWLFFRLIRTREVCLPKSTPQVYNLKDKSTDCHEISFNSKGKLNKPNALNCCSYCWKSKFLCCVVVSARSVYLIFNRDARMGEHGAKINHPFCNCLRVISIPMDDGFVLNRPLNSLRTQ